LRALRGLVRLKTVMEGPIVKRQAMSTLRSMQTLARVQSQIRSRRVRMLEENQALQRQLLQKHARELETMRVCISFPYFLFFKTLISWHRANAYLTVCNDFYRLERNGMLAYNQKNKLKPNYWASMRLLWEEKEHWLMHSLIRFSISLSNSYMWGNISHNFKNEKIRTLDFMLCCILELL
jgi:hypothetical protein